MVRLCEPPYFLLFSHNDICVYLNRNSEFHNIANKELFFSSLDMFAY